MKLLLVIALILVLSSGIEGVDAKRRSAKKAAKAAAAVVPEIFIIPHSHDDTGWLRTVDQYHEEYVRYILDDIVTDLMANPTHTFVEVEIAFFQRWWLEKDNATRANVRTLVKNGQLEFINGGWCMADEAVTHFEGLVNQLTLGHTFLKNEVGVNPRVGWSIDPFGASATFAAMFADMGYDAFVINRIHYELKTAWSADQGLEFVWRGTPSRNDTADMFTHVLDSHYSAPWGFDWEYYVPGQSNSFDLANTNPALHDNTVSVLTPPNIQQRAAIFAGMMTERATYFKTPNVLVPFGDDFKFKNPHIQFRNMDMLMKEINDNVETYGIRMRYSTASQYFDAVKATETEFPVYHGDFFPYAFAPDGDRQDIPGWASADSYWAGFYTSRPQLKGWARAYDGMLHATEMAYSFMTTSGVAEDPAKRAADEVGLKQMREASAVVKHHDAETGTSVPYVVQDFMSRLLVGGLVGANLTSQALNRVSMLPAVINEEPAEASAEEEGEEAGEPALTINADPLRLASACDGDKVPVVIFNSLARVRREVVRIGLDCANVAVSSEVAGVATPVLAQVNEDHTLQVPVIAPAPTAAPAPQPFPPPASSKYNLYVLVEVPPVGFTTIFVEGAATSSTPGFAVAGKVTSPTPATIGTIANDLVSMSFNTTTGELAAVKVEGSEEVAVYQQFMTYDSETHWPDSTAYIFRPTASEMATPVLHNTTRVAPALMVISGPVVQEVIQTFNPVVNTTVYLQQTLRLFNDPSPNPACDLDIRSYIESSTVIGMEKYDRELITRFTTGLDNRIVSPGAKADDDDASVRHLFYTDANGLDIKQREKGHPYWEKFTPGAFWMEPVAVNYYPAPTASFIRDEGGTRRLQFTVVTDRAHGVGCLGTGELEVMMHRRNSVAAYPSLDDTSVIHTKQAFSLATYPDNAAAQHRALSRRLIHQLQVFYGTPAAAPAHRSDAAQLSWTEVHATNMSFVQAALPPNVALQSFDLILGDTTYILRLRHMFAVGEHTTLSLPVTVNLDALLNPTNRKIVSVEPVSLSANQPSQSLAAGSTTVQLHPLQTVTFIITVASSS